MCMEAPEASAQRARNNSQSWRQAATRPSINTVLDAAAANRQHQPQPLTSPPPSTSPGSHGNPASSSWSSMSPTDMSSLPFSYQHDNDQTRAQLGMQQRQQSTSIDWTTLPALNYNPAFASSNPLFGQLNTSADASPATSLPSQSSFSYTSRQQASAHGSPDDSSGLASRRSSHAWPPAIDTVAPSVGSLESSSMATATARPRPKDSHTPGGQGPSSYQPILPRPAPPLQQTSVGDPLSASLPSSLSESVKAGRRDRDASLQSSLARQHALGYPSELPRVSPPAGSHYDPSTHANIGYGTERRVFAPPSLWMSPMPNASAHGQLPHLSSSSYLHLHHQYPTGAGGLASTSSRSSMASAGLSNYSFGDAPASTVPTSASTPPSIFSDILSDELFNAKPAPANPQLRSYPSPPGSVHSPQPSSSGAVAIDDEAERLAKEDPLATQVWKMYARAKASLPHAQRMENLTWRMMAMALKKRRDGTIDEEGPSDLLDNKSASAPAGPVAMMMVCNFPSSFARDHRN